MKARFDLAEVKAVPALQYIVRFAFGGLVTVATGVIASAWGPEIGGLFLAFPAVLPASLTFIKRHDGRSRAADDARGARLGALALTIFAVVVWGCAHAAPPLAVLAAATAAWTATSALAWHFVFSRKR